jgi:hypothetical protein
MAAAKPCAATESTSKACYRLHRKVKRNWETGTFKTLTRFSCSDRWWQKKAGKEVFVRKYGNVYRIAVLNPKTNKILCYRWPVPIEIASMAITFLYIPMAFDTTVVIIFWGSLAGVKQRYACTCARTINYICIDTCYQDVSIFLIFRRWLFNNLISI